MALQNFFKIFLLIVHVSRKSMQEKKLGVTVLVFEIREAKGHFEGKLLRLCCNSNWLSGTKNNGIQKQRYQFISSNQYLSNEIETRKIWECQTAGNPDLKKLYRTTLNIDGRKTPKYKKKVGESRSSQIIRRKAYEEIDEFKLMV